MPELNAYVAEGSCNAFMIEDNTEVTLQIDNNLPTTHRILSIAGIMSVIGNPIGLMGIMSSGIESEHTRQTNSSLVIKLPIIFTFSFNKNTSPAITSGYAIKRKKVTR